MKSVVIASLALTGFVGSGFASVDFRAKFEPGLPGWKPQTGGNSFEVRDGGLAVTREKGHAGGTAWELESTGFAVTPGEQVSLLLRARSTFADLRFAHGFRSRYITGLRWYDADGKPLPSPWGCGCELEKGAWRWTVAGTVVPPRAATARLCLGFDTPNFGSNDVLAVSDARVLSGCDVPARDRVTLRDDGFVLVGGRPFFPIGIYAVNPCEFNDRSIDRAFRDLKAAGFNLVHRTRPVPAAENEEFLSLADRHGLKVFITPVVSFADDFVAKSLIPAMIRHPSILAWYLADDTADHVSPETVSYRNRIVKAQDPHHLTLQADAVLPGGANCRYDPFVHSTDIFLPEIYPVTEEGSRGCEVAEVVRDMKATAEAIRKAGNPVKSVWPICQHFDGWDAWKRFPTAAELRAMSWAALVHGGHGIVWYVYNSQSGHGRGVASDPARFAELAAVSREIAALSDDLLTRTPRDQPEVRIVSGPATDAYGNDSVTVLLKGGESPLLISVNAIPAAVRATVGVRGFARAEVIGEGRELAAGGGLTDDFAPYAVHLYRLRK